MILSSINKILFFCLLCLCQASGQMRQAPFKDGEQITYVVYYNWGFIWLKAAVVDFSVTSSKLANKDVYKLFSTGNTIPSYDWFFPVRDTFTVYSDTKNLFPLFYAHNIKEGNNKKKNSITFDYEKHEIKSIMVNNGKKSFVQKSFSPPVYDLLSAVYFCRKINFDTLKLDQKISLPVIIEDSIYDLFIRYKGREIIETKDGNKHETIKISVKLIEGTIFKEGEDMFVWIIDDKSRVPVMIEAKILIGSVKAFLVNRVGI